MIQIPARSLRSRPARSGAPCWFEVQIEARYQPRMNSPVAGARETRSTIRPSRSRHDRQPVDDPARLRRPPGGSYRARASADTKVGAESLLGDPAARLRRPGRRAP